MPIRYLMYLTEIIKSMLKDKDIYDAKLIKNASLSDIISYTGLNEDQIIAIANNYGIKLEE